MKKVIFIILSFTLIFSAMPINILAAEIPSADGFNGTSQIRGHHDPKVTCSTQNVSHAEAEAIRKAESDQKVAAVALAVLGFASVQGIIAKSLSQSISWVSSNKTATSVIGTTVSSFGLVSAVGDNGSDVGAAGNYEVCEYKHLVDTRSNHWDSWTDYAHYAGQVMYKTTDNDTGRVYYLNANAIAR
ncbi:hypothetical protein NSQ77_02880 [Oceanobacillus sp. FSL K6-2867]|uniref:hypothetical protein n=1 Tax=Oceanobacillus sp. FSL K6-2867 TaxID=2954748 RepID=UPI0030DC2287